MGVCIDEVLYDELDASVACGSGIVAVAGPPGSGKTTSVLDYLARREMQQQQQQQATSRAAHASFCVEYVTAKAASGDIRTLLVHRLQQQQLLHTSSSLPSSRRNVQRRRRLRASDECTTLDLADALVQWCEVHEPAAVATTTMTSSRCGSELHLVVDDVDVLDADVTSTMVWLSSDCLDAVARRRACVYVWLLSQLPLRVCGCFRYHRLPPPSPATVLRWLQAHVDAYAAQHVDMTTPTQPHRARRCLTALQTHDVVAQAVHFYRTHLPMSASVVSKDVRQLLQRVYALLPTLLAARDTAATTTSSSSTPQLNAMQLATAWHVGCGGGRHTARARHDVVDDDAGNVVTDRTTTTTRDDDDVGGGDVSGDALVVALLQMSHSAALLAFAAFYCGAVPPRRQVQALATHVAVNDGKRTAAGRRGTAAAAVVVTAAARARQSHTAAVLSSTAHVVTAAQLRFVYAALRRVCVVQHDALEFAHADAALAHFVDALVAWGLLTPTLDTRTASAAAAAAALSTSYHCYMAVTTALQLGRALGLSLYDLIPA